MKFVQLSAFAAALVMSSVVLAEGGGDRVFEKMMAANDRSVEAFVAKEQARNPVVLNEKRTTRPKTCKRVAPELARHRRPMVGFF